MEVSSRKGISSLFNDDEDDESGFGLFSCENQIGYNIRNDERLERMPLFFFSFFQSDSIKSLCPPVVSGSFQFCVTE